MSSLRHTPELDLAVDLDASLDPALRAAAGALADPGQAEELWRSQLSRWLGQLVPELPSTLQAGAFSLGLQLTDDIQMAALNATWRDRSGPTDVLAFAAQEGAPPTGPASAMATPAGPFPGELPVGEMPPLELGDIVISLDTAARQASSAGHSLEHELLFLASHGLLHLLGWDHPDGASLAAMLERQELLLQTT